MKTLVIAYLAAGAAFLIADAIWLTTTAQPLYRPLLGDRLADPFHLAPAVAFYFIYIAGIVFFAVLPGLEGGGLAKAALNGAVLGFVAYATYDLTNHATLRDWPLTITLVDITWGTVLTGFASAAGFLVANRFTG